MVSTVGSFLSPAAGGGLETASRSAFQRKSHAVGEGQQLARRLSPPERSKRLPLICRLFLAFGSGDIFSPRKEARGEEKGALPPRIKSL